jgi:hypothetical protein
LVTFAGVVTFGGVVAFGGVTLGVAVGGVTLGVVVVGGLVIVGVSVVGFGAGTAFIDAGDLTGAGCGEPFGGAFAGVRAVD